MLVCVCVISAWTEVTCRQVELDLGAPSDVPHAIYLAARSCPALMSRCTGRGDDERAQLHFGACGAWRRAEHTTKQRLPASADTSSTWREGSRPQAHAHTTGKAQLPGFAPRAPPSRWSPLTWPLMSCPSHLQLRTQTSCGGGRAPGGKYGGYVITVRARQPHGRAAMRHREHKGRVRAEMDERGVGRPPRPAPFRCTRRGTPSGQATVPTGPEQEGGEERTGSTQRRPWHVRVGVWVQRGPSTREGEAGLARGLTVRGQHTHRGPPRKDEPRVDAQLEQGSGRHRHHTQRLLAACREAGEAVGPALELGGRSLPVGTRRLLGVPVA
eukprot:scaffold1986_cov117-Isochrysis_galbana.AAC.2